MLRTREYVGCIIFDEQLERVILLKKTAPNWQAGKWNFPGGKIEQCESPVEAVIREVKEETNLDVDPHLVLEYSGGCLEEGTAFVVYFYAAKLDNDKFTAYRTMTDERVMSVFLADIEMLNTVHNVPWIMSLASSSFKYNRFYSVKESAGYAVS